MNAHAELLAACHEWRHWTELEGQAAISADWMRLRECQAAKQDLQPRLSAANDQARRQWTQSGGNRPEAEQAIRQMFAELIALETRNRERLGEHRSQAEAKRTELEQSRCNLRRLHRSYGGRREPAWSSFS
jgi:hypothetical protein